MTGKVFSSIIGFTAVAGLAAAAPTMLNAPAAAARTPAPVVAAADVTAAAAIDPAGYADQLIRDWGRGDRAAAATHATASVVTALFDYADPGGVDWARTGEQGAAGTIYVTYRNFAGPGTVIVGVNDSAEATGHLHAVYTVRISR